MSNYLQEFTAFGAQPSLGERIDERRDKQATVDVKEQVAQEMRGKRSQRRLLTNLYDQFTGGNQAALQQMAGVDPQFHMELQKGMAEMDEATRKQTYEQLAGAAQKAMYAKQNPQVWGQVFPNIPFEQADEIIAQGMAVDSVYKSFADQQNKQNDMAWDKTKFGETVRHNRATEQTSGENKPTTDMRKYSELVDSGVPDEVARGVAYGTYRNVTDPASGATLIVDLTTNRPIGRMVPSDPSKPYSSGFRWEPDMREPDMKTGMVQRGQIPQDTTDPLGLFK